MKKLVSLSLAATIISGVAVCAVNSPAYASESDYTENGIHYQLKENLKAAVTGCDDGISKITINNILANGYDVEEIAKEAFQGNLDLETVICKASLDLVGDYAFECCSHLKNVTFEDTVSSLGSGAFALCSSLVKAELPNSVSEIGNGAFLYDKSLKSFDFPSELKNAGHYAFAFSGITSAQMDTKMSVIPERLFYQCENLTDVTFPSGVTAIENYAFGRTSLENLHKLPDTVRVVGDGAFIDCNFSNLTVSCVDIGKRAFENCSSLNNLTFTKTPARIDDMAFKNAVITKFTVFPETDLSEKALYDLKTDEFVVENNDLRFSTVDGVLFSKDKKTLIAFRNNLHSEEKQTYTVPDGVKTIAPYAFSQSHCIGEVILPDSVTSIGEHAFANSSLKKIILPDSVKVIGEKSFANCNSLTDIDLGKAEQIGSYAFDYAGNPEYWTVTDKKVKLPDTMTDFDTTSFINAYFSVEADGGLKTSDDVVFTADGKKILAVTNQFRQTEYTVPSEVEEIAPYAFQSAKKLEKLYVTPNLKAIGEYGFGYRDNHGFVQLTEDVMIIGEVSEGVRSYGQKNDVGIFSEIPSLNTEFVELEGGQTAKLNVKGTDSQNVIFSSFDSQIASVSADGTVTGLRKGYTTVIASVGSVYFPCSVMVNSDSDIPYTGFDESGYLKLTSAEYPSWKENYRNLNGYLTDKLNMEYDDRIISMYQGSGYYMYMNGATDKTIYENKLGTDDYGEGYEEMFTALNHACGTELSRYKNSDSMVLYSGAGSDIVQRITGGGITLAELKNSVGKQFDVPMYTSTTLDPCVSNNFYQKGDGITLVIYADKETLATYQAGYIAAYHPEFEYELLLATGQKFEVLDAGIRWLKALSFNGEDYSYGYERYVKLKLLAKTSKEEEPTEKPTAPSTETPTKPEKSTENMTERVTESFTEAFSEKTTAPATATAHNGGKTDASENSHNSSSDKNPVATGSETVYVLLLIAVGTVFTAVVLYRRKKHIIELQ